jgi:hypothetical protein
MRLVKIMALVLAFVLSGTVFCPHALANELGVDYQSSTSSDGPLCPLHVGTESETSDPETDDTPDCPGCMTLLAIELVFQIDMTQAVGVDFLHWRNQAVSACRCRVMGPPPRS